jgi:hypothetical protein
MLRAPNLSAAHLLLACALLCLCKPAIADSYAFLKEVVEADWLGDSVPRVNRVDWSKRQKSENHAVFSGPAEEAYQIDVDPLIVVDFHEFVKAFVDSVGRQCVTYKFNVIARTVGKGLPSWNSAGARKIARLHSAQEEYVDYCAILKNKQWMIQDPPLPRVSRNALVDFLNEKLSRMRRIESRGVVLNSNGRAEENIAQICKALSDQLNSLH